MPRVRLGWSAIIGLTTAFLSPAGLLAQTAPSLGSAQSYAILAGSSVTNAGSSSVTGDLGVSPGSSVSGFPPGVFVSGAIHAGDASAAAAQTSLTTAYNDLAGQACTQDLTGQDLGGMTLTAGVYCFSTSAQLTGILTLDAQGNANAVFIFKIGSTLTTASGASVIVINSGSACNVFWQVGSSATLGTGTALIGNILAQVSITVTAGASVTGRALARTGTVSLDTNAMTATCLAATCPVIVLSPATLPNGTVGAAYSQTLVGSGGTTPYSFGVTAGTLPAGLTLTSTGVLAGTPTTAGTSTFTIRGTDANGCFASVAYTLVIAAAPIPPVVCPAITVSPATLPNGTVGAAYTQTLVGSGGTTPYSFGVTAGTLPAGLALSAAGVLAGTPTTAGTSTFTIRGTDANGCFASVAYTLVIAAAPIPPVVCPTITVSPATLLNGTVGAAYTQTLVGSGGTAPYSFGVTAGALPAGLILAADNDVEGTPTTVQTSTFTIRGTDANGCFASVAYTLVIAAAPIPPVVCPAITVSPATLPNGTVGAAYSQTLVAGGGTGPYSFGITAGALPAGLELTAAGRFEGTPTTAGTSHFTVRGTDANGCFASVAYTIVIAAAPVPPPVCPVITFSPATLPNGTVGVAYIQTLVGSGGAGPYRFGVTAGTLPAGLTLAVDNDLEGTPTTAQTSIFTIRGTDANGCFASRAYTIVIAAAPVPPAVCPVVTLSPATLPNGTIGAAYSQTLVASGGTGPYSFGITAGALPAGLKLTAAGRLSGTPTTAGTSTFTIRGTDANGCFASIVYTMSVAVAVTTLPETFSILLILSLISAGYVRLRQRAHRG